VLLCFLLADFAGVTPFMSSAQSGDVSTVKYLLDHGGDLTKSDAKGRTVLHHAACIGSSLGPSPTQFVSVLQSVSLCRTLWVWPLTHA